MKNIIVSNPEEFEKKKKEFIKGHYKNLHVLADFDRTLTKAFVDGEKVPSVISILRNYDYLNEDYSKKANELFDKYHPIEINPDIIEEEKKKRMQEWWTKHFNLLIKSGLNKSHLERIVNEEKIQFREGVSKFLDFLKDKDIPLVIISSSGIGDVIPMLLKKQKKLYDNVHIATNLYEWDSSGKAIKIKKPFIHVLNKTEVSVKELPIYSELQKRKNVLLLGDSLGDLGMIKGFDYDNLISVGFLNEEVEKNLEIYKKNFDVIITHDGNFDWINDFIKEIKE